MRYEQKPSRVAIDEQQERKQSRQKNAKRHRRKHRKNYILYYIILLFFTVVIGATLSLTVLFHVEKVIVTNNEMLDPNQIITSAGVATGSNLLRLNSKQIENNIYKSVHSVDDVKVIKRLPSTLEIEVKPAKSYLSIEQNKQYYIISEAGRLIEIARNTADNSYSVYGLEIDKLQLGDTVDFKQDELKICLKIISAIKQNKITNVTKIDITNPSVLKLYYDDRIEIKLGNCSELDYKLQIADEIIQTKITQGERGILDVQVEGKAFFKEVYGLIIP